MNRTIKEKSLTRKVALYESKYGLLTVNDFEDWIEEESADYVRVFEPIKVTFVSLADEEVLNNQIKSIDAKIEHTRAELTRRINELTDQKNRLLAITHQAD